MNQTSAKEQQIPPAPRTVRWRAARRYAWVAGLLSLAWTGTGLLVLVIFAGVGIDVLPLADDALDADCAIMEGVVTSVEDSGMHMGSKTWAAVRYTFEPSAGTQGGRSFVPTPRAPAVGDRVPIEYLDHSPEVSRIRHSRRNPMPVFTQVFLGIFLLPGIAGLLWWLRGVNRLRIVLTHGRLTEAEVVSSKRMTAVNPPHYRVQYRFADGQGREHDDSHWVPLKSPLIDLIEKGATHLPLIHDEADAKWNRLTWVTDFRA